MIRSELLRELAPVIADHLVLAVRVAHLDAVHVGAVESHWLRSTTVELVAAAATYST